MRPDNRYPLPATALCGKRVFEFVFSTFLNFILDDRRTHAKFPICEPFVWAANVSISTIEPRGKERKLDVLLRIGLAWFDACFIPSNRIPKTSIQVEIPSKCRLRNSNENSLPAEGWNTLNVFKNTNHKCKSPRRWNTHQTEIFGALIENMLRANSKRKPANRPMLHAVDGVLQHFGHVNVIVFHPPPNFQLPTLPMPRHWHRNEASWYGQFPFFSIFVLPFERNF